MKYFITSKFLVLGKALNIYIDSLMLYLSREHVKYKSTASLSLHAFNNDIMRNRELNFCKV